MNIPDKKYCGRCVHAGKPFWIHNDSDGLHVHCEHPDVEISGEPGWDSLRRYKDIISTCQAWANRKISEAGVPAASDGPGNDPT